MEDEEVAARASCARASRPADEAVDDEWSLALLALLLRALPTQGRPPVVADCAAAAWPMDSPRTLLSPLPAGYPQRSRERPAQSMAHGEEPDAYHSPVTWNLPTVKVLTLPGGCRLAAAPRWTSTPSQ